MPEIRLPRIRLIRVASSPGKPPMSRKDFIKEDLHQPNELTADTEELKIETPGGRLMKCCCNAPDPWHLKSMKEQ